MHNRDLPTILTQAAQLKKTGFLKKGVVPYLFPADTSTLLLHIITI